MMTTSPRALGEPEGDERAGKTAAVNNSEPEDCSYDFRERLHDMTDAIDPRPTLFLVQGAWHRPQVWLPLQGALFNLGYLSTTTTLPSGGVDPVGGMHDDAAAIRAQLAAIDGPVVLLAHSYGGIPATEAAAGLSNVTRLIYLAAYLPDKDQSMYSINGLTDPDDTGGHFPAIADPRVSLYGDLADAQARHATDLLVEQTTRSFTERVREAAWRDIPVSYILCEHDQAIPPALQEQMATHAHATTYRVASGHSPFLSMPVELAALIDEMVTGPTHRRHIVGRPAAAPPAAREGLT
jgi:pimeloyl-ACP methyl ester carboxylesterase